MQYDASGRLEAVITLQLGMREVVARVTTEHDPEGHAIERPTDERGGEVVVEQIAFEGTCGAAAECGTAPHVPPGIPEDARSIGFGISP